MLQKLLLLALAGALGTLARYSLIGWIQKFNTTAFPWGTLTVNLLGCFLAGLLWALFENRWSVSHQTQLFILAGFMGAFTTFSAFMLETGKLLHGAEWLSAATNIAMQNGLGFIALAVGATLGRWI